MNVRTFPSVASGFYRLSVEIMKSLGRGLGRLILYTSCSNEASRNGIPDEHNPTLQYFKLQSAVEHLTREVPVTENFIGEKYFDRVNDAPPEILAQVLKEFGYTQADVEAWRTKFAKPTTVS